MTSKIDDVADLNDKYLPCRVKGHPWEHLNDEITRGTKRAVREVTRLWVCPRCTSELTEVVDFLSFEIVKHRIKYPPGYLFDSKAMGGRVLRPEIRREQFRRAGFRF